ncbi:MAG: acetate--CoA ligase family protein, partial [Desulfomonilia bacterium]
MASRPLQTIMNPSSVVFAGASNDLRKMGTIQMLNLIHSGYQGEVTAVHPKERLVLGKKAYPSPADLPYAPDLAILVVPTAVVPGMLEEFGKIGVRHAIIISAGFRETGEKGRELERRIIEIAGEYGIRFLGPNCLGIVNSHVPLNVTVAPSLSYGGGFSLASQSGTYISQSVHFLRRNGVVLGKAISVGNEANIGLADCLEYFGEDEQTKAIGLYIEGLKDANRFLEAALKVSARKPIVAQYVGGTEAGARSGSSHTGAMAGPDYIYDGLFEQAGIIRVATIEEVYRIGWTLATQPPLKGPRIAILTNSGGPGTGIATTCNALGLEVPEFSPEVQEKVSQYLPGHASARNPVDLTFHVNMDVITVKIPEILFSADEIDGVIIHGIIDTGFLELLYPSISKHHDITREQFLKFGETSMEEIARMPHVHSKPLLISSFFDEQDHSMREFHEHSIPTFDSPEKAARAMWALYRHCQIRSRGKDRQARRSRGAVPEDAKRIMGSASSAGLDEFEAKQVLASYGIPTPREVLAREREEAFMAARSLGFPVAVKACSAAITHKTEHGLVFLDVNGEEAVGRAFDSIRTFDRNVPV